MSAFNEVALFEQNAPTGSFYDSGSPASVGETPGSFSGPLKNKAQIRLSFNVKNPVKMLANSSSIYYFSPDLGQWRIPTGSVLDHTGPFDRFAYNTLWFPPSGSNPFFPFGQTVGTLVLEDSKGFDARGRPTASGSLSVYRQVTLTEDYTLNYFNQTNEIIGKNIQEDLLKEDRLKYVTDNFPASVPRNIAYQGETSDVFVVDIDEPFLIEKAVFEIPINAGPTWFQDRTATSVAFENGTYNGTQPTLDGQKTYNATYYDIGGPTITLSLFSQKNYGTTTIRDLILSGTITHEEDCEIFTKPRIPFREGANSSFRSLYVDRYGTFDKPSGVIKKSNNSFYTGTVTIQTQPAVSNGYVVVSGVPTTIKRTKTGEFLEKTPEEFLERYQYLYSTPSLRPNDLYLRSVNGNDLFIKSIDPFGRGMTGFDPSGGSIYGGEYSTVDPNRFQNPLYIPDENLRSQSFQLLSSSLNDAIAAGPAGSSSPPFPVEDLAYVYHTFDLNFFSSHKISPYLLRPGEKLVLALSKTRPALSSSFHDVPNSPWPPQSYLVYADVGGQVMKSYTNLTGSTSGHDVTLATGSINITLYGSYVRGGNSYIP
jgi:hypothetical protein